MNPKDYETIVKRAKTRKDGVYCLLNHTVYRVKNNIVTHYTYNGNIIDNVTCYGLFAIVIGTYSSISDAKKKLLSL